MPDEKHSTYQFSTRALHVGQEPEQWNCRAVVPPIFMSTTFSQFGPAEHSGYEYGRSGNPTRSSLEKCLASLEKGKYSLSFASGLGTQTAITNMLKAGDHILTDFEVYGGTSRYFRQLASKFSLDIGFHNFCDLKNLESKIKSNTKLVWFEAPTNPLLRIADIAEVCKIVKAINSEIIIVVDNTFITPYFSNPLNLGADIVMNSITKYINGHSDVIMGMIATNRKDLYEQLMFIQNAAGIVPSPFDCYLVNRGLKTLSLRMEKHQENALKVARYLESHKLVEKVLYPGLESHPDHALAKKQFTGYSGMVSFYIRGDLENAKIFLKNLKIATLAESLGAVETLIEIPSLMTHASLPKDVREQLGISDTMIRLSVGIENVQDLINDLDYALQAAQ